MTSKIVIVGITNMKEDRICISGYDLNRSRFLRPLLPYCHITIDFLNRFNKTISLGSVVDLELIGNFKSGNKPHCEDVDINPQSVSIVDGMTKKDFKQFLLTVSDICLEDIYGNDLELIKGQPVVPEGAGLRSLGVIVCRRCTTYKSHLGRIRCDIVDKSGGEYRNIPVVARDEWAKPIGEFRDVPIRMGLSRLWKKDDMEEPYYWVHVSALIV